MSAHSGKVMLIAAGPGVLACAVMGAVELGDGRPLAVELLGAYPLALLAFLPAIPVLAWTIVRAFPPRARRGERRPVRHGWLIASWFAPCWHAGAMHVALRAPLLDWNLVLRHSACLWLVTLCGWLCVSHREIATPRATPASPPTPHRPATAGTIHSGAIPATMPDDPHDDIV